ncbi:MAG: DUF2804 domain-containing protein, partial [Tenericutes bacterium HGW-Tenericutes-8]
MSEQYRLTKGPLLDEKGQLIEAGYHEDLIRTYDKKDVTVKGLRLKEWDYYYIGNEKHGIALTLADNSYMWLASVTIFDFEKKLFKTVDKIGMSIKGLNMPNSSRIGDIEFKKGGFHFRFIHEDNQRRLLVDIEKFMGKKFSLDVTLKEHPNTSLVIAMPFQKKGYFYYNHKINLMDAFGSYTIGQTIYPIADAFGTLDWGRGVWTYKNTWYWSSASGKKDGIRIGFNLGYGFGDTTRASENMFYYDGQSYKFDDITFEIPKKADGDDYMSQWVLRSKSNDIYLEFQPILDRNSNANLLVIKSLQHQVFGKFSGHFILPSGE